MARIGEDSSNPKEVLIKDYLLLELCKLNFMSNSGYMTKKHFARTIYLLVLVITIVGCTQTTPDLTAQQIVDEAIVKAGGEAYLNSSMNFNFRDLSYENTYSGGKYSIERIREDSTGLTVDVIDNNGYRRLVNGKFVVVHDTMAIKYTNSVNSVHYFARLPYGLNDAAVNKTLVGKDTINDKVYYEIEVHFAQEGGGVDFQDIFMYWFDITDFSMDYLAYSYETEGGGVRFREAFNQRTVKGISFADYINYKPSTIDVHLSELDDLFVKGQLTEVSKIELENIEVVLKN